MKALKKQGGVSFGGFIMVLALLGGLAITSMKFIPVYMENAKIQKAFDVIVQDPAMQAGTNAEIQDSFYKRANVMDAVSAVTLNDIVIARDGKSLSLSANYTVKVPLAGNVSLLIEFSPHAPK